LANNRTASENGRTTKIETSFSMHLFDVTYGAPEVTEGDPAAIALVLILAVLAMNAIAIGFRMRLRRRTAW
jgi:ABC-type phosphate transport system permease subunit